jgi:S-adenosylmethionine synthetase
MNIYKKDLEDSSVIIQYNTPMQINSHVQIIERKGWGHPDKLADDLAETLSRAYSQHTLKNCGAVLHHNFDKLCLLGGRSEVSYGSSKIVEPIRVLVNGRVSRSFGGKALNVDELITNTCKSFFKKRLPLINCEENIEILLNINLASSPGGVISNNSSPRHRWFNPSSIEDLPEYTSLYANDTSLGTGYAPKSCAERLMLELTDHLSKFTEKDRPSWLGTDVKIMGYSDNEGVDLTICVPQIARYVESRNDYIENLKWIKQDINNFISKNFPDLKVRYILNARDKLDIDEIYLTALGSSIESGDEGVVGRGNRVNGLITPMRPMNLEGANGKNPVYHVGKVYNVLANGIANELYNMTGRANFVNLISRTGKNLLTPWKTVIQFEGEEQNFEQVCLRVEELCSKIPELTNKIIKSTIEEFPLS